MTMLRPVIAVGLVTGGLFQMALPALALGTAAGAIIRNTATATYQDEDGNNFEAESNEVTVTVAKVAGITNEPSNFNNLGTGGTSTTPGTGAGGTLLTGQNAEFTFTVTNTGNDLANIVIPAASELTLQGLSTAGLVYEVSTDGGTTFVDATAGTTIPDVAVDGEVLVRVVGTVTATAAGAPVSVRLGNTGSNGAPNIPAADTQNQPDIGGNGDVGGEAEDVRTENAAGAAVTGNPANDQREASALAQQFLGSNPLALARIEKTNAGFVDPTPGVGPNDLADATITYNLELDVETVSPDPLFTPADLEGRNLTVTGIVDTTNLVLVSDAIPANTALNAASAVSPTTGSTAGQWTLVFTGDDPNTIDADDATWNTNDAAVGTVTRIGWVYDAEANGAIARGETVTGFAFTVTTSGITDAAFPNGTTIANIAQVFGSTDDGAAGVSGTPIFDESGDQDPSNFNGNTPGPNEDDPESNGVADPANHNTDANNDNSVVGDPGGEDNVVSVIPAGTLLNGPDGEPGADGNIFGVGPDNNHDFQNKATLPTGTNVTPDQNTLVNPDQVQFDNTLSNPDPTNPLTGVLLQPIQPSFAGGDDTDIPVGTTVRLDIFINGTPTSAQYTYDGTNFNITAGTPILIPSISPGVELDYDVTVDLPGTTPLSTDQTAGGTGDDLVGGFPIPIIAFIDGDSDGTPDPGETSNITVNQVYTGFVRLVKQSRILQGTGPAVAAGQGDFSIADKTPAPGNIIEYRIVYRNISEAQAGSGTNDTLIATNMVLTEDGTTGTATTSNNWALDLSPADGTLDTVNVPGSADDTSTGSIVNYATGNPAVVGGTIDPGVTTTGYQVNIPSVPPTGTAPISAFNVTTAPVPAGFFQFTFQRTVSSQ